MSRLLPLLAALLVSVATLPARAAAETPAPTAAEKDTPPETGDKLEGTTPTTEDTPKATADDTDVPPVKADAELTPPAKAEKATDDAPDASRAKLLNKVGYIAQHALMGGGVVVVLLAGVALAVVTPILVLIPSGTGIEFLMPQTWRSAVGIALLAGVVPGLIGLALFGAVATGVSAVRNMEMFTGGGN